MLQKQEDLLKAYASKKVLSTPNSLRQGIFEITGIESLIITTRLEDLLVSARWHPQNAYCKFKLPVTVQLSLLFNKYSVNSKFFDPGFLIGLKLKIVSIELLDTELNGRAYQITKMVWQIVGYPQRFIKYDPAPPPFENPKSHYGIEN
jgi:hypothetical protein